MQSFFRSLDNLVATLLALDEFRARGAGETARRAQKW